MQNRNLFETNVYSCDMMSFKKIHKLAYKHFRNISEHIAGVIGNTPYLYMDPYFRVYNPYIGSCEDDSDWDY